MNAGYVNGVSDNVAALRSARGAHKAQELNKAFAIAEAHSISRAVFVHGPARVAEVVRRTPAAFQDHHGNSLVGTGD